MSMGGLPLPAFMASETMPSKAPWACPATGMRPATATAATAWRMDARIGPPGVGRRRRLYRRLRERESCQLPRGQDSVELPDPAVLAHLDEHGRAAGPARRRGRS